MLLWFGGKKQHRRLYNNSCSKSRDLSKHHGSDADLSHCSPGSFAGNHVFAQLHSKTGYLSSVKCLSRLKGLQPGDIRHLKIVEDPSINHLLHIAKEKISMQYNFGRLNKVVNESRFKWASDERQLKTGTLV